MWNDRPGGSQPPRFAARPSRRALLAGGAGVAAVLGTRGAIATTVPPRVVDVAPNRPCSPFRVGYTARGITSLRHADDAFATDYVAAGAALGGVLVTWRRPGGDWQRFDTRAVAAPVLHHAGDGWRQSYVLRDRYGDALALDLRLVLRDDGLHWRIGLASRSATPIEIGDLALPLPMSTRFGKGQAEGVAVLKHSFVSGHGSHLFWMRPNSVGPFLTMLPGPATSLEYWDREGADTDGVYRVYILSAATVAAQGGRWRQPHTAATIAPEGSLDHGLLFGWANDYRGVRDAIAAAGAVDVEVVPSMTLPTDLDAHLALASSLAIEAVEAEHPGDTTIEPLGRRDGRQIYRLRFARLGENRLAVRQAGGRVTWLEFFATEPVETLIAKRGAFIARHQHRDPTKWYDGLFGEWNMASGTLLGPDHYDRIRGWRIYEVTCDDPGLSKPAFLAGKNAEHPVQWEIDALDRYVACFVWGGLQQRTDEPYPYAIYGIPDWKTNRDSADAGPKGRRHVWRPYDYPHIAAMYLGLYRIAVRYPHLKTALPAAAYLARAAGTATAMFVVPQAVIGWSAYDTGFYNECVIPAIVAALDVAGEATMAADLRAHWDRKVRTFVNGRTDLFGSEYDFDSTGFESTQALARTAIDACRTSAGATAIGIAPAAARAFADRQIAANLFCRGWLEPSYYYLGSDYRANGGDAYSLSYMAQMGGWAVLDHALHDASDPAPLLRLGYASILSSWALMNSGTAQSDYGYWFPGAANDGGAGGGFEAAARSRTWLDQPNDRGAWYYSCEIDLGFCGALRAAATILADDPVFGRICFGGVWETADDGIVVSPRDGVRRRFHARLAGTTLSIEIEGARFAADRSIRLDPGRRCLAITVDRAGPMMATAGVRLSATSGDYAVANGEGWSRRIRIDREPVVVAVPIGESATIAITAV